MIPLTVSVCQFDSICILWFFNVIVSGGNYHISWRWCKYMVLLADFNWIFKTVSGQQGKAYQKHAVPLPRSACLILAFLPHDMSHISRCHCWLLDLCLSSTLTTRHTINYTYIYMVHGPFCPFHQTWLVTLLSLPAGFVPDMLSFILPPFPLPYVISRWPLDLSFMASGSLS